MPRGISRRVGSRQLPVTSYVVLGLIGHKPGGGYSLATFAARSISHMWPITRSQVYAELPRLESLGLIAGTNVMQEKLPDKCTYELTDAGTDALLRCARERQHGKRGRLHAAHREIVVQRQRVGAREIHAHQPIGAAAPARRVGQRIVCRAVLQFAETFADGVRRKR